MHSIPSRSLDSERGLRRSIRLAAACAFAIALFSSASAHAQEVPRALQLSFGVNALSYERLKTSLDGKSATATSTDLGPEGAGFSLGIGLRPTPSWLVGLNLQASRADISDGRDGTPDAKHSAYAIMPRLEYWFPADDTLAPYAGATIGLRGSSASAGPGTKVSTSDFAIGGLAGVRVFAAPGLSIDPNIALLALSGRTEAGDTTLDRSGFAFVLGVSLSGWLTTGDAPAAAASVTPRAPLATPPTGPVPSKPVAPPVEVAAEAPPPLAVTRDDDGTLRSEIWLSDGRRLRLTGRPSREASSVLVTLLDGTAPAAVPRTCTALNVVIDGRPHAIVPGPRPVPGSGAMQVLMPPAALLAIGQAKQSAHLERCGASSEIVGAGRSLLGDFYREFRATAERYGHSVPEALPE